VPLPKRLARRALSEDWFERALRFGHLARGVVFGAIGFLALRLAMGDARETPDMPGALEALADQPLDVLFLSVLSLGLLAYALWELVHAIADLDDAGGGVRGWARRLIPFTVGLTYLGFAAYAFALLLGMRRDNDGIQDETASIMQLPLGRWIVGAIAAGVIIAGVHELFVAFTGRFKEEFRRVRLGSLMRAVVLGVGWWGHASRGAVYVVAGWFGMRAAVTFDPDEAKGFADTLSEIGTGEFGGALLGAVATGLIAFGVYSVLLAAKRHIPDPDEDVPHERLP
jgi:hypothetical protein